MPNSQFPNNRAKYDIYSRIFEFIVDVINLTNRLPKTPQNIVVINQVLRSATSMGANSQEADGSNSKKDFIHGLTLVRKEGKETLFWLNLIHRTNPQIKIHMTKVIQESNEIIAIISTIIKKTNDNSRI